MTGTVATGFAFQMGVGNPDRATERVFDTNNRMVFSISPLGFVREYLYDAKGNDKGTVEYASRVNRDGAPWTVASVRAKLAGSSPNRASAKVYDAAGRLFRLTDAGGVVTDYRYDGQGRQVMAAVLAGTSPGTGDSAAEQAFDAAGHKVYEVDGLGYVTGYLYDSVGNVVKVTRFAQAIGAPSLAAGARNLASLVSSSEADRSERYFYDNAGRLVYQLAGDGQLTCYERDALGRVTGSNILANPPRIAAGSLTAAQVAPLVQQSAADKKQATLFDATGLASASVDALGRVTGYSYNAHGELAETIAYAGTVNWNGATTVEAQVRMLMSTANSANRRTGKVYDGEGRIVAEIGANGDVTGYRYNAFGQVAAITSYAAPISWSGTGSLESRVAAVTGKSPADPLNRVRTHLYDLHGREVYLVDSQGFVVKKLYNSFIQVSSIIQYAKALGATTPRTLDGIDAYFAATTNLTAQDRRSDNRYNARGQVETTFDASGFATRYDYNAAGQLIKTSEYARAGTRSSFNSAWNVPVADPAQDRLTHRVLDPNGRLRFQIDPLGGVTETEYDRYGEVTRTLQYAEPYTSADVGLGTLNSWGASREAAARGMETRFDAAGRPELTISAGGSVTRLEYDGAGQLIKRTEYGNPALRSSAAAPWTLPTPDATIDRVSHRAFDSAGQLCFEVDALGNVTEYEYDSFGGVTRSLVYMQPYTGSDRGLGALLAWSASTEGLARTNETRYNAGGKAEYTISALGSVSRLEYNATGQLTKRTDYAAPAVRANAAAPWSLPAANATLDRVSQRFYDLNGRLCFELDALAGVTEYEYDGFGALSRSIEYADSWSSGTLSTLELYSWASTSREANGRAKETRYNAAGRAEVTIGAAGNVTKLEYNAAGQLIRETEYGSPATRGSVTVPWSLPSANAAKDRVHHRIYANNGQLRFQIDAAGNVSEHEYDAFGAMVRNLRYAESFTGTDRSLAALLSWSDARASSARASETRYTANGQVALTISPLGSVTRYEYDTSGQPVRRTDYAALAQRATAAAPWTEPVADARNDRVTRMLYDRDGQLRFQIDAQGFVTENEYDGAGAVVRGRAFADAWLGAEATLPALILWAAGQSGAARTSETQYNAHGQAVLAIGAGGEVTRFEYSATGVLLKRTEFARPAIRSGASAAWELPAADAADRISYRVVDRAGQLRFEIDPLGGVTEFEFDGFGAVVRTLRYNTPYTAADRSLATLNQWASAGDAQVTETLYGPHGNIQYIINGLGSVVGFDYDTAGRWSSVPTLPRRRFGTCYMVPGPCRPRTRPSTRSATACST